MPQAMRYPHGPPHGLPHECCLQGPLASLSPLSPGHFLENPGLSAWKYETDSPLRDPWTLGVWMETPPGVSSSAAPSLLLCHCDPVSSCSASPAPGGPGGVFQSPL